MTRIIEGHLEDISDGMHSTASYSRKIARLLNYIFRFTMAIVFVASAVPKLQHPYDFLHTIYGYEIVGPVTGIIVAAILPWIELITALALILGIYKLSAACVNIFLGILFTVAQLSVIHHGITINCGCFGGAYETQTVGYATLLRAFAVIVAGMFILGSQYCFPEKNRQRG